MKLNQKIIDTSYKLMEMLTKGYQWYHDTPEKPFEYTEGSIWLINPDTKKWLLELKKSGDLWYYYETPDTFSKYLNMEESDFKSFIKIWMEDVLKRGVVSTLQGQNRWLLAIEDALERGVVSTTVVDNTVGVLVEDALKRGVVSTPCSCSHPLAKVEDVLKRGVVSTRRWARYSLGRVEDALKNGKKMELNENTIKSAYKLMEMITKGYQWYTDTPEQPFEYSEGSIWLINPETGEWILELEKSGVLWYEYETPVIFSKYLNMGKSDFQSFIKIWVEDVLKKGVSSTFDFCHEGVDGVEDVLENGKQWN